MTPDKFANELRRIALTLAKSKRPSPSLVLKDINRIASLVYMGKERGWIENDEVDEEELEQCEKCGEMVSELRNFGPEGSVCEDCLIDLQQNYRGKPMGWNCGSSRQATDCTDDNYDNYDRR
jgi:hypothetical protein